jgi:hypothetical protein
MAWLEAILAFAVTMMALSTMVSMIVETFHRVAGLRERGLCFMTEQVFQKVILPKISVAQETAAQKSNRKNGAFDPKAFAAVLTSNRFIPQNDMAPWYKKIIPFLFLKGKSMKTMTTLEFIERLGESPAGHQLLQDANRRGKAYLDMIISDIANKYEDFGESAREYFTRRARLVSVGIAVVLAFSINFDAIHVFKAYLSSQSIRAALIEKGDDIAGKLKKQEEKLNEYLGDIEKEKQNKDKKTAEAPGTSGEAEPNPANTEKGGAGDNTGQDSAGSKQTDPEQASIQKIKENQKNIKNLYDDLLGYGVPIGWNYAPFNAAAPKWDNLNSWKKCLLCIGWFISVLIGGFLIGLGGPFWFDFYKRMSVFTNLVKGLQSDVQKQKDELADKKSAAKTVEEPGKISRVFLNAAVAKLSETPRGRTLLSTDGTVYMKGK